MCIGGEPNIQNPDDTRQGLGPSWGSRVEQEELGGVRERESEGRREGERGKNRVEE